MSIFFVVFGLFVLCVFLLGVLCDSVVRSSASAGVRGKSRVAPAPQFPWSFLMPKDAKFGMVVGVSLVIVVAVVFFRKEAPAIDPAAATIVKPAPETPPPPTPVRNSRAVQAKTMAKGLDEP
jgi:hypothetical protein